MDYSNLHPDSGEDFWSKNYNLSDNSGTKPKFKFPAPPRISKSANNTFCSSNSDSSKSSTNSLYFNRSFNLTKKKQKFKTKRLPPLGIYWDIENCQVPKNKSAAAVVKRIREVFLDNYRESEFVVVCDIRKESSQVIQELHDAQIMLLHVSSTSKNAADDKLRQALRRFGELHPPPSAVVLISSDINFASDLSDLRYKRKIRVTLVHNVNVADALILCANEHHSFTELMKDLPANLPKFPPIYNEPLYLDVTNLPRNIEVMKIKNRLRIVTDNCGGKVHRIKISDGTAVIKYNNIDDAIRAQRRIQGEDVFGNKIKVSPAIRNFAGQKIRNLDHYQSYDASLPPPPGFTSDCQNSYMNGRHSREIKKPQNTSNQQVQQLVDACAFRPIRGASSEYPMEMSYDNSWWAKKTNERRNTPQDQLLNAVSNMQGRNHESSGSSEYTSDEFRAGYSSETDGKNFHSNQPVDLIISNLDPTIEPKELKRALTNMLKEYAMILSLNITVQNDGTPIANIRVNGQREAQFTISQLHRQKLGHKRIIISYAQSSSPYPEELKAMVIELLQEVPDKGMPLFKFINLLESRYHCTVSVSEVNKLKDICKITDSLGSRIISLNQEMKTSPPPHLSRTFAQYCTVHCPNGVQTRGWCELSIIQTPNVKIPLKLFSNKLLSLLKLHMDVMHLLSFQACYEQEFHEPLPVYDGGVPLEHLVTCIPNIDIKLVGPNKNIKIIRYADNKNDENEEDAVLKSVSPHLAPNITLLCRELIDLLKTQDRCQLLMSKFIPAYHHHFGRQCRVADYGYTKLLDLFESIPHIIQILGDGTRRTITLTHSAQMRRFTSDLLRVLKVQPAKQITLTDFPSAYEKVINKPFNAVEYGLCTFEDLLHEVSENTVVVNQNDNGEYVIAVPKREQTAEEIMRTKQFASEVIDLLRHSTYYTMFFNKFVPAYHHHFGHQCKVSNYGFTKLIELFEAIPEVVKIEELSDGERTVSLTLPQALKVLGSQIVQIIKSTPQSSLALNDLPKAYLTEFGYPLEPNLYECTSVSEILTKLTDYVQVVNSNSGLFLVAIEIDTIPNILTIRCWALLLKPPHYMDMDTFRYEYQSRYNSSFSLDGLQQIGNVISVSSNDDSNYISLTNLYILAAQLYHVIYKNGGSVLYFNLEKLYQEHYGKVLKFSSYQIYTVADFYNHFNLMFFIKSRKMKSIVLLNRNLAEHFVPLPPSMYKSGDVVEKNENSSSWPPPPPFVLVPITHKRPCPPKPDTPPSPDNNPWNLWSLNSPFDNRKSLSIKMPIIQNPQLLGDPYTLISPARQLLPSLKYLWGCNNLPSVSSPDPTELPIPDKLMLKGGVADDSADSGVNIKLDNSPSDAENEAGSSNMCENGKPSFATLLDFTD
ncbi:meiosis regulator and mRNA stability factor 1 [Diorhabda sublineata]|uniref:meiosis regulator and mRNA stability factor 1 n=1 Tax=Diorhabda sublineata TaxID=1163346 RepID=UPI0024E0B696|nr:meiosis regulator and mRNA stability factor 1 [Diorhabda sublineata]